MSSAVLVKYPVKGEVFEANGGLWTCTGVAEMASCVRVDAICNVPHAEATFFLEKV